MEAKNNQTKIATPQGWHPNTELSVNLKSLLHDDCRMQTGKDYQGVLRRDVECEGFLYDEHFTFVETATHQAVRRNPRIFSGRYITVTRWADGSYHPNFRPMPMREDLTLERYALGVYNELCMALGGLIEEE